MKKIMIVFLFLNLIMFISNAQTDCQPVTITDVTHEGAGNRVTWTPHFGNNDVVISHSDNYKWNFSSGTASFGVYHRFIPEQLSTVNEGRLSQVVFVPTHPTGQVPGHTYTIQIYQGGVWGAPGNRTPGTLIVSQELHNENLTFNKENTITLETPVTIDALQELWIGCFCTNIDSITTTYKTPIGKDEGPVQDGFGNLAFYQNKWFTLFEDQPESTFNICFNGKVQTVDGATVNIYCNEESVATNIAGTTYLHEQPEGEKQCYKVEVNCVNGSVSPLSKEACITWEGIGNYGQTEHFTVYPNPAKNELRIENGELRIENIEIYDVYGRNVLAHTAYRTPHTVLNVSGLHSGIYFVKITTEQGIITKKIIIMK
jgi:hypothetical protein